MQTQPGAEHAPTIPHPNPSVLVDTPPCSQHPSCTSAWIAHLRFHAASTHTPTSFAAHIPNQSSSSPGHSLDHA